MFLRAKSNLVYVTFHVVSRTIVDRYLQITSSFNHSSLAGFKSARSCALGSTDRSADLEDPKNDETLPGLI
jgi:hypothetical protein